MVRRWRCIVLGPAHHKRGRNDPYFYYPIVLFGIHFTTVQYLFSCHFMFVFLSLMGSLNAHFNANLNSIFFCCRILCLSAHYSSR